MKLNKKILLIAILMVFVVLITAVGCKVEEKNEYLQNITLSTSVINMTPDGITDEFSSNVSKIYCTFDITDKVDTTSGISILWIYIYEKDGDRTEYLIQNWTEDVNDHKRMSMYILQPFDGWYPGNWRADLYVDNERVASIPFRIKQDL